MTLVQWLNRVLKTVVRDGQCVAFFRQYIQDVWKVPAFEGVGATNGAKEIYNWHNRLLTQAKYSNRIAYTGSNRPNPGDVVIFDSWDKNKFGHIGVFVCMLPNGNFMLASQNGLEVISKENGGDGKTATGSRLEEWGWNRVLGWLEKKGV